MATGNISKQTHYPVYESDDQLFYQDGKILLQEKKTGKMVYVALTEEVARAFDMRLEDDAPDPDVVVDSSNEENSATADEPVDSPKLLWTPERTIFLIETIETFSKRLESEVKKHVWEEISKRCNEILGITITNKQAESKWKSLKRTYKSVLLHNNTSGKNRRHWEYFNKIHAIMYKRPEITPIATCSSFSGLQSKVNSNIGTRGDITPTSSIGIASESAIESNPDFEISTPQSSFSRKRRNRESEVSKRHLAKMERLDRFNDLFEKMVEKM